jgi:O-antigen/teichoic acid export membrane protein
MKLSEQEISSDVATAQAVGSVMDSLPLEAEPAVPEEGERKSVIATFLTTLTIFGVFLVQGIIIAHILGPEGRGMFGTALYFPRDVLLYAGLLGGIEIVNSYAVKGSLDTRSLKFSAAKLGLISGIITALFAVILSVIVLSIVGKTSLIYFCLFCCLFVPFEHMQLTISAVDRGNRNFKFYNINRLIFALSFPLLVIITFGSKINLISGLSDLAMMCFLFVLSRTVGLLPTLRGMDVWDTLKQRYANSKSESTSQLEPTGLSSSQLVGAVASEEVSVPGPWTLLINGRFYALSMLASELFERLDIFLIVALATITESGHYFVAVPAAAMLTVAPNALAVFTFNAGADKERKITLREALGVMAGTAVFQAVAAIVFSLIVPYLIVMLYPPAFSAAVPFALWLLPAAAIKGYLQAADGFLKGRDKPMIGVWARVLSIFLMLGYIAMVYGGVIRGPEQKLLSIPIAACLGQAVSMVIISVAVVLNVKNRHHDDARRITEEASPCP